MTQTVVGIFNSATEAQSAVDDLLSNGFTNNNVDVSSGKSSGYSGSYAGNNNENEGGVSKFFKNLFGNDNDESDRYTKAAERGTVVTVHAESSEEAQRAAMLLDQYGAVDVDGDYGMRNTDTVSDYSNDGEGKTINVIEENLQVGKREIETGGVRLRSRIVEKPVEENLRLREEHVRVERNTVDRPATEADFNEFNEGTIELTEHAEVPVVSKEARVVEEVSLGKEVEHREETIHDTVRKTEVDIEEIEGDKKSKRKK